MADALVRFLARAGSKFTNPFGSDRSYTRPQRGDPSKDVSKIAGDMRTVGGDLTRTAKRELAKHG